MIDAQKQTKALLLAMASELHPANLALSLTVGTLKKLTELHLWKFKLEILQSRLPHRPPKTQHLDVGISDLGFLSFSCIYFFSEKNQSLLDIHTVFENWEKYKVS